MSQLCRKTQQSTSDVGDDLISHGFLRALSGAQVCAAWLELHGECIRRHARRQTYLVMVWWLWRAAWRLCSPAPWLYRRLGFLDDASPLNRDGKALNKGS